MITPIRVLAVGAIAVTIAFAARAVRAEGDPAQGRLLAYTCLGCHGIEGYRNAYPSYRVPKIGGQKREYIEGALRAYRDGTRPHATMQAQSAVLSDQDIEDLAAWFAGEEVARDTATEESLNGLDAAKTCLTCHGAQAEAVSPTPPTLAGQHRSYLDQALQQYRSGARSGTVMSAFAGNLSEDDVERIAEFYSRQQGLETPDRSD